MSNGEGAKMCEVFIAMAPKAYSYNIRITDHEEYILAKLTAKKTCSF